eukprot:6163646-Ditylum_brightwellii.AAC.1
MNDHIEQFSPRDNRTPQYPSPDKGKYIDKDSTAVFEPNKAEEQTRCYISDWQQSANPPKEKRPRGQCIQLDRESSL